MTVDEEIKKLESLCERGILTEDEMITQQGALLYPNIDSDRKNRVAYMVFALFLGIFGVHNFYVGRWKRGLCQLLMTLLTCFIGAVFVKIWAIVNIFTIKTDGKGNPFIPGKKSDYIWSVAGYLIIGLFLSISTVYEIAVAIPKYQILNYVKAVQTAAGIHHSDFPTNCSELAQPDGSEEYFKECTVYPEGNVELVNVTGMVRKTLLNDSKIEPVGHTSIMIPPKYHFKTK